MTEHFMNRVRERIPGADPDRLWAALRWAIENNRRDLVSFVCRQPDKARRIFRFYSARNNQFYRVVVNTVEMKAITVYAEEPEL